MRAGALCSASGGGRVTGIRVGGSQRGSYGCRGRGCPINPRCNAATRGARQPRRLSPAPRPSTPQWPSGSEKDQAVRQRDDVVGRSVLPEPNHGPPPDPGRSRPAFFHSLSDDPKQNRASGGFARPQLARTSRIFVGHQNLSSGRFTLCRLTSLKEWKRTKRPYWTSWIWRQNAEQNA